jgi:hypothetical protein
MEALEIPHKTAKSWTTVRGTCRVETIGEKNIIVPSYCCASRHRRPRRGAPKPRDELPALCMTRKEHCEG